MNENLLRMKKDTKFCVFDFETEDLNLFSAKPWQFACVVGTQNKIIRKHDLFIGWKDLNISREAELITRFNEHEFKSKAQDPKKCLEIINQEFSEAEWISGHNILGYDIHIYRRYCRRMGVKPYPIQDKFIDTMCCGKGLKLDIKYQAGQDFLSYQIKMANEIIRKRGFATLSTFAKEYEIETKEDKLHDALYDVEINFEVLKKMLWHIEI